MSLWLVIGKETDNVETQLSVVFLSGLVKHEVNQVESREKTWGQIEVVDYAFGGVVSGLLGIGGGQNGGPCV